MLTKVVLCYSRSTTYTRKGRFTTTFSQRFVTLCYDLRNLIRFAPESGQIADPSGLSALCQKQTFALQQICLFNHLVGAGEQRRGHVSSGVVKFNVQVAVETWHISSSRTM